MRAKRRRSVVVDRGISFEHLEPRSLFSVPGGSDPWLIQGTPGDDEIIVSVDPADSSRLVVKIGGEVVESRTIDEVSRLKVFGLQGDDTIRINLPGGVMIPASLHGGRGDDSLYGGAGNDFLGGGYGDDQLDGGGGVNTLRGFRGTDHFMAGVSDTLLTSQKDTVQQLNSAFNLVTLPGLPILPEPPAIPNLPPPTGTPLPEIVPIVLPLPNQIGPVIQPELPFDAQALLERLADAAVRQYQYLLGTSGFYYRWDYGYTDDGNFVVGLDSSGGTFTTTPTAAEGDFSGTNNQVDGVEEADRVQTDGRYLYLVDDTRLLIFDTQDAQELHLVSALELGSANTQVFLHDGIITAVTKSGSYKNPTVTVRQIDVTDPADPRLLETTTLDGSLLSTRQIGDRVYVVTTGALNRFPRPIWFVEPLDPLSVQPEPVYWTYTINGEVVTVQSPWTKTPTSSWRYESVEEYRARFLKMSLTDFLPSVTTTTAQGLVTETLLLDDPEIFAPDTPLTTSLLSVTMFQQGDGSPGADDVTTVLGGQGQVYADTDSLYVASYNRWSSSSPLIQKFDLTEEGSDFAAAGSVVGRLLNQFSMDEHEGLFRIATTQWAWPAQSSQLSVLQQQGNLLVPVGQVTGLGPSQQIYSVRFMGDTAYVVTYRKTDPLYVIDLSEPTTPIVAGELHIPGFSSYLHPIGEDLLIGVGRIDVDEDGLSEGVKLSLFDVSDPANPIELHQYTAITGDRWSVGSAAENDHHAFSWFPQQGILSLPVETGRWRWSNSGWSHGQAGNNGEFQIIKVSEADGFTQIGTVQHASSPLRSVRIGDVLYTLSETQLAANNLYDASDEYSRIDLNSILLEGTLRDGTLAIGGGTTGVVIQTGGGKEYELDLRQIPDFLNLADRLNGKPVVVEAVYERFWRYSRGFVGTLVVKSLKPAE